jgi:hypothetical protein
MRHSPLAPILALLAVAAAAPAQAPARAGVPDTPVGRLGERLLDAINLNDSLAQVRFVREHVSAVARDEASLDDRVAWLRRVAAQSGGLELVRASGDNPLEMILRTRRGRRWVRIYAFTHRREPSRHSLQVTVALRSLGLS